MNDFELKQAKKALSAVREYDRLIIAIEKNTLDIGDGLASCSRNVAIPGDEFGPVLHMPDGEEAHISEAFTPFEDDDGSFVPRRCYNSHEEIGEIISECNGCKKAYAAILERKANKKALGAIKRSLRWIARGKGKP